MRIGFQFAFFLRLQPILFFRYFMLSKIRLFGAVSDVILAKSNSSCDACLLLPFCCLSVGEFFCNETIKTPCGVESVAVCVSSLKFKILNPELA